MGEQTEGRPVPAPVPSADTERRQARIAEIRRWRDHTADRFGHPHRFSDGDKLSNVKAWWRDVDALLNELDAAASLRVSGDSQ